MKWTEEDRQFVRERIGKCSAEKIAMMMGLTKQQVEGQIRIIKEQIKNGTRI